MSSALKTTFQTTAIVLASLTMASATVVSASVTANAGAGVTTHECGSKFEPGNYLPTSQHENSDYFQLKPILFDDAVYDQVRHFGDRLNGRWYGTLLDIRCLDTYEESHTSVKSFRVDAEIEKHFQGAVIMEVHQENAEETSLDRVFLAPETELDPILDLSDQLVVTNGQRTGHRSYQLDFSIPDTLIYNDKYRRLANRSEVVERFIELQMVETLEETEGRRPAPFGQRLVHEIKTVSIKEAELTVYRDVYVDGHFVAQQHWQLRRI